MKNCFAFSASCLLTLCAILVTGCEPVANESSSTIDSIPGTVSLPAAGTTEASLTNVSYRAGETITVNVPEMHCPFYCFPKVEETLVQLGGIEELQLVEQKAKDKIDDPRIVIKLSKEFDWSTAAKAIEEAGFPGATVVLSK